MPFLYVSNEAGSAEVFATFIPKAVNPLSSTDSMNGAQVVRNIHSLDWCVARQPIGGPTTVELLQTVTVGNQCTHELKPVVLSTICEEQRKETYIFTEFRHNVLGFRQ